jgi:HPt (histidine-containing phosphotransfer) domain-containing protein
MSAEGPASPAIDVPALMARVERDLDLLAELLDLFGEDSADLIARLEDAVSASDADAVWRAAHTLKGAVANFCAPRAVASAAALEAAGRDGNLSTAPSLLASVRADIEAVRAALAAIVGGPR